MSDEIEVNLPGDNAAAEVSEDAGPAKRQSRKEKEPDEAATGKAGGDDVGSSSDEGESAPAAKRRTKGSRAIPSGIAHIKATFNNTAVAITDTRGGVIAWSSGGRTGFKGSRKSTAFAATMVGQDAARQAVGRGMHEVEVRVQGAGSGRESAIRALQSSGLNISVIKDVTPIPHNGCRARKRRRV